MIKQTQETWLGSRYVGVDKSSGLSLPDNVKIAESYGIKSIRISNNKDVNSKLNFDKPKTPKHNSKIY